MKLISFVEKICNYKFAQNFTCRRKKVLKFYCNKESIKQKFMNLKAKKTSHLYMFLFFRVQVLDSESKGSWFKPHQVLGWAQRPNIIISVRVTFGSNKYLYKYLYQPRASEAASLTKVRRWAWGSQVSVKKISIISECIKQVQQLSNHL